MQIIEVQRFTLDWVSSRRSIGTIALSLESLDLLGLCFSYYASNFVMVTAL